MNKIGEENINYQGLKMTIIKYRTYDDIDIQFEDGNIRTNMKYGHFKTGQIKNIYYPEVCNVGFIGNANCIDDNGKVLRSYKIWVNIIERCYNKTHKFYKNYGYKGVTICNEWLCYANFKEWYEKHYYELDNERVELDKDILVKGNKVYSPDTCVFVPRRINVLFRDYAKESKLPKGVSLDYGKYKAYINIDGKKKSLGRFNTPEEAKNIYEEARLKEIKRLAEYYKDKIPEKLYNKLIKEE